MLPWNPGQWTEEYVKSLIGEPESSRLEFKSGLALSNKQGRDKFVREGLSPAISAFANSEGGAIVIGIREAKRQSQPVASAVDGVVLGPGFAIESMEQFGQIVETCISPYLAGIRVRRVQLSGPESDRSVLVLYIPQGVTAYQARDYIYYTRAEYQTNPMPDHEVRVKMARGRTGRAQLNLINCRVLDTTTEWLSRQNQIREIESLRQAGEVVIYGRGVPTREELEAPARSYDEYCFSLAVANTGEVTLRDFLLQFQLLGNVEITRSGGTHQGLHSAVTNEELFRYRFDSGTVAKAYLPPPKKLFPGDTVDFPPDGWVAKVPAGKADGCEVRVLWTIYLDDGAPLSGELDVLPFFGESRLGPSNQG